MHNYFSTILIFLVRPTVIQNPINSILVNISSRFELSCQIDGIPTPNITWWKNNQTIISSQFVSNLNGTSTLIIDNALVSDTAKYNCRGENIYGIIYTSEAKVTILCKFTLYNRNFRFLQN